MALRIRYAYNPGLTLGYSIERLADNLYYDFADGTFKASPGTLVNALTAGVGSFAGLYKDTIATTPPAQFTNGEYDVNIHNTGSANLIIGVVGAVMYAGDSGPVFPGTGGAGTDPWATMLPGAYGAGTAGGLLGARLTAAAIASAVWQDATAGDFAVAGSTGEALMGGTLLDKVAMEIGLNAKQAIKAIFAAEVGKLSGAAPGPGTITIGPGGGGAGTRITAAVDGNGNRTSITLTGV